MNTKARRADELKATVLHWRAFQESTHSQEQANRYSAELFALTGEVLCRGMFVKVSKSTVHCVVDALHDALDFAADQEDVVDGPDGVPQANKAMQLAGVLRAAVAAVTGAEA